VLWGSLLRSTGPRNPITSSAAVAGKLPQPASYLKRVRVRGPCQVCEGNQPVMNNQQLIQQLYAAYARGDHAMIRRIFDPRIAQPGTPDFPAAGTYITTGAILQDVFGPFASKWASFALVVRDYICEGDRVIVRGTYRGHDPETNLPLCAEFAHIYTVSNRRVVAFDQQIDPAQVLAMAC